MFGQNKPPHFSDPKYDEKIRKYNAKQESSRVTNRGNTGVPALPFIALGVFVFLAFILITTIFRDDTVSPARAFGNENIKTDENYNFEIVADKEIKAETYDNVLVETDYTLFPKYESSIIDLKEDNYFEEAPAYSCLLYTSPSPRD